MELVGALCAKAINRKPVVFDRCQFLIGRDEIQRSGLYITFRNFVFGRRLRRWRLYRAGLVVLWIQSAAAKSEREADGVEESGRYFRKADCCCHG